MRKIINRRRFDTETATMVGEWSNSCAYGDLDFVVEALYRTPRGAYFLHGEGGARSGYAKRDCLGGWTGGEDVTPLDYAGARSWAEEHLQADEYEAEFGAVIDAEGYANVRVTVETRDRLRRMASERKCAICDVVAELVG